MSNGLPILSRRMVERTTRPIRVLQFGEGNFLRAFADWMIHEMNHKADFNAGVTVVQPIDRGLTNTLSEQDGLYTLYLNGIKNGQSLSKHEVVDCIQKAINPYQDYQTYLAEAHNPDLRFIVSNTTEAGIKYDKGDALEDAPPSSFPAKLTVFLFKRYRHFEGAKEKGLIFLPCELIDKNGENLQKIIIQYAIEWGLEEGFKKWIEEANTFYNTLVDRIVPGYPGAKAETLTTELGYQDKLLVEGEMFHLWVIEGPAAPIKEEFPAESAGLNVIFTDDMQPYRTRKVRILNGAHTILVPVGYLYGIDKVRESVENEVVGKYLKEAIFEEICPTLDLPEEELHAFANDVIDRFKNPYLEHALASIALNSIPKFKTRVLPSILGFYHKKQKPPKRLLFSLASLICFYKGKRGEETIPLNDSKEVLDFFSEQWSAHADDIGVLVRNVLRNTNLWGDDLTTYPGFENDVSGYLNEINDHGMNKALNQFLTEGALI